MRTYWLKLLIVTALLNGSAFGLSEQTILKLAPAIKPQAVREALSAMQCAQTNGIGATANRLAIIDYSLPSRKPRLWVFDLKDQQLLFEEYVAHGKNSGADIPHAFSNREGSLQTSLGLFLTDSTYQGGNGYSLKLHGLNKGLNDAAMQRAIVMHGAKYVNPLAAESMGRLGRSWGCPAVRSAIAVPMINTLKNGQFIYAFGAGTAQLAQCNKPLIKPLLANS
jgi:hypothetical protein